MDGSSSWLQAEYEGAAYSAALSQRVRWIAHCVSMWSCFSLAYYAMDLVAVVQVRTTTLLLLIVLLMLLLLLLLLLLRLLLLLLLTWFLCRSRSGKQCGRR